MEQASNINTKGTNIAPSTSMMTEQVSTLRPSGLTSTIKRDAEEIKSPF